MLIVLGLRFAAVVTAAAVVVFVLLLVVKVAVIVTVYFSIVKQNDYENKTSSIIRFSRSASGETKMTLKIKHLP